MVELSTSSCLFGLKQYGGVGDAACETGAAAHASGGMRQCRRFNATLPTVPNEASSLGCEGGN